MSGPKVVKIVTLEEVTATCKGYIARLDQAIKQWQKSMDKLDETDEKFYTATIKKRNAFDTMIEENRFLEIQKLIPMEIASLHDDIANRRRLKISVKTKQAIEDKQAKQNIKALITLLNNKHVILSDELDNSLKQAINGKYQGNINQLLHQAFSLLKPEQTTSLSQKQQKLLDHMDVDKTQLTFAMWLQQQKIESYKDPYIQKITNYLAELELDQKTIHDEFALRLADIEKESLPGRKKMLLDSFVLDLAQATKEAKERISLQQQLELLIAELQQKTTEPLAFDLNEINTANITQLKELLNIYEQKLIEITQQATATYRQQAILQGLAGLGYEVQQGMQTQWVKEGRLVLRNPITPGYGIELAGKAEIPRMQVRVVKWNNEDNQQRDKDVETLWCGDFTKLQQWLAKQGSDLVIEKALPVGTTALKTVINSDIESVNKTTKKTFSTKS